MKEKKKKLLVILGAGSSIECGMPSVGDINALMEHWAGDAARALHEPNYYAAVWRAISRHLANGFESMRVGPDYERALGDLVALMLWVRPSPAGGALRTLVADNELPRGIAFPNPAQYGPYISVKMHWTELVRALARHIRSLSTNLDLNAAPLRSWRLLLDGLRARFDVAIYNLNYDAVASRCWPDAATGFDGAGRFDARLVHQRPWEGLMHLHGSVNFSLADASGQGMLWRDDLSGDFDVCDDRTAIQRSDGRDFAASTLIAGAFKLDQLLGEPFASYHSALMRDATQADAILLGGYGFGDAHVNAALKNALRRAAQRPRVLVLDRASPDTWPFTHRQDGWARSLRDTLYASGDYAPPDGVTAIQPIELAALKACERSLHHGVGLWYSGFAAAGGEIERLAEWLDGGSNEALAAQPKSSSAPF